MKQKLKRAELARELKLSRSLMSYLTKTGKLVTDDDGFIDISNPVNRSELEKRNYSCDNRLKRGKENTAFLNGINHVSRYHEARAKLEEAKAAKAELSYKREVGELVKISEVEKAAFEQGRKIRDALLMIENKFADKEVKRVVKEEINKILEEISK